MLTINLWFYWMTAARRGEVFFWGAKKHRMAANDSIDYHSTIYWFCGNLQAISSETPIFSWCLLEHLVVDVLPGPSVDDGHEGSKENLTWFID